MAYLDHLPQALSGPDERSLRPANIVISGTTMWNPGDDFVRAGVVAALRRVTHPRPLNLFFYNFSADVQPPHGSLGTVGNNIAAGDLEKLGNTVDAVVIAGLSAGHEIKDLYNWVIAAGLVDRTLLIGAGYENSYVDEHCRRDPEATIFRNARLITGRTAKTPDFIAANGTPYAHIPCPSLLSVPACKPIAKGHRASRLGFSIQLPTNEGIINQATGAEAAELAMRTMLALDELGYDIALIAHHKTEYTAFARRFRDTAIKVHFQTFATDLPEIYRGLDAMITTRLHAGLYANAHGLPALIINDTDRHTHALDGFRHAHWANTEAQVEDHLRAMLTADLGAIARELQADKDALMERYKRALTEPVASLIDAPDPRHRIAHSLRQEMTSADTKRRVVAVIERLTADHWLEINTASVRDAITRKEHWFDATTALHALASILRPRTYFEVGVRRGRSLAQVLAASPDTRAFGFDLWIPDYGSIPERGIHVDNPGPGFVADELDRLGLPPATQLIEGNSRATLPAFFADTSNPQEFDLLHIDGDHTDEGALADLEIAFDRVAEGGVIVFDDLYHPSHAGLKRVWDSFKTDRHDWLFIEDTDRAGTAVAIRPPFDKLARGLSVANGHPTSTATKPSPKQRDDAEPVHYFTIVLNGMPFIEHHLDAFIAAGGDWHWHIVEGVGDLKHDTAWSVKAGGRIPDSLHDQGRSVDGTTEYLDRIAAEHPDRVTVYRKPPGEFWDGKVEMVNAPLASIDRPCLLWQIDADELWTPDQLRAARELFAETPEATAAYYRCHYFVGPDRVITSRDTYGNHSDFEWLRTWRYRPGYRWAAHEPPRLVDPTRTDSPTDIAALRPIGHNATEAKGLIFQHFAYTTEAQLRFKEDYYGYADAVNQWRSLQRVTKFPARLADHFAWVRDDAVVELAKTAGVRPLLSPTRLSATPDPHASTPA